MVYTITANFWSTYYLYKMCTVVNKFSFTSWFCQRDGECYLLKCFFTRFVSRRTLEQWLKQIRHLLKIIRIHHRTKWIRKLTRMTEIARLVLFPNFRLFYNRLKTIDFFFLFENIDFYPQTFVQRVKWKSKILIIH